MRQWWMCTSGRASDPSWSALSLAARGLLATLEDSAASTSTAKQNTADKVQLPPGGLDAYLSTVARGRAIKTAREALAELSAAGWFVVDGSELVLRGRVGGPPAQRAKAAPTPAARSPETIRADRSYFNRRERAFKNVPPGVTWDEWVATPDGAAYRQHEAPRCGPLSPPVGDVATEPATLSATPRATHGTPGNVGVLNVAEEKIEREDTHTTRVRARTREGDSTDPGEPATAEVDPAAVVESINRRSKGLLKLRTYGDERAFGAFGAAVRAAVCDGVSVDLIERIGDHAAHGGFAWRTKVPLSLDVIAKELSATLTAVDACNDCNGLPAEWDQGIGEKPDETDPWGRAIRNSTWWFAFVKGSGGRINEVSAKLHNTIETNLVAANLTRDEAERLGAFACEPRQWAKNCRDIDLTRPPTLQELAKFDCAALAACINKFRAVDRGAMERERRNSEHEKREREKAQHAAEELERAKVAREAVARGRPLFAAFLDSAWVHLVPTEEHAASIDAVLRELDVDVDIARAVALSVAGIRACLRADMARIRDRTLSPDARYANAVRFDELTADDCAELRAAIERYRTRATGAA